MKIVLTKFAIDRHFDPDKAGTTIEDRSADEFEGDVCTKQGVWRDGYAPFCKLLFIPNWTDAKVGTVEITGENEGFLESDYIARNDDELPVLVRWLELREVPRAEYLCLVLYNREQLAKEGTNVDVGFDADWGIVAILGQSHDQEEPMPPVTAMRNALGKDEGGSGVPLDREAYARSVEFWGRHATVKVPDEPIPS